MLIFRGDKAIRQLADNEFRGQVRPVPSLFHDKLSRQDLEKIPSVKLVFVPVHRNSQHGVQNDVGANEGGRH